MNVKHWIEQWCSIFPKDAEFGGYRIYTEPKYCISKMEAFQKKHPEYTKDIIFKATQMYIDQQKQRNWEYTKQATYFISKLGQPSVLEMFCQKVIENKPFAEVPMVQSDFI